VIPLSAAIQMHPAASIYGKNSPGSRSLACELKTRGSQAASFHDTPGYRWHSFQINHDYFSSNQDTFRGEVWPLETTHGNGLDLHNLPRHFSALYRTSLPLSSTTAFTSPLLQLPSFNRTIHRNGYRKTKAVRPAGDEPDQERS
jgi:hypothetical protein